jgi:hypothetical protein
MKKVIGIFVILIASGCSFKNHIVGKYASNENSNAFQFMRNSTFRNQFYTGHLLKDCVGKWEKESDSTIILNTAIKSTIFPLLSRE